MPPSYSRRCARRRGLTPLGEKCELTIIRGIVMTTGRQASTGSSTSSAARQILWGHFLDPEFCRHPTRYIAQCGIATLTIFIVLLLLDSVKQTVLIASLGASSFIAFTMPHVNASKRRYLIGGYIVGTCVGCLWAGTASLLMQTGIWTSTGPLLIVFGAVATGSRSSPWSSLRPNTPRPQPWP